MATTTNINSKPTQAIILAGGRGQRLHPITEKIPKPMILFHGKPFLEYIIESLKEQGFTEVVLLVGYLHEQITSYFGDGSKFGIDIKYSITDVSNETGPRLAAAKSMLDPIIFLTYCDNYCPVDTQKAWEDFCSKPDILAQITVYSNLDNFTRNNLRFDNGLIATYDKSRSENNLNGVDIGFAFMKSEVLNYMSDENLNFEKVVYPKLVQENKLAGFLVHHRYYSVGNLDRLPITEKFLKREPVILLDRDGVLNVRVGKGEYVTEPSDFHWIPGSIEAISLLKNRGYKVIVISNQAGIARGIFTEEKLQLIHSKIQNDLAKHGVQIDHIYYCPHGWDEKCFCRKPQPGMLFQAQREFCFDLSRTYFVGDDERDIEAGLAAGSQVYLFKDGDSLLDVAREIVEKNENR